MSRIIIDKSLKERFNKSYIRVACGCWEWTGSFTRGNYGHIFCKRSNCKNGMVRAHRVSMALFRTHPGKSHVMHLCDNPKCVNPDHLVLGSHKENMADKVVKGRHSKGVSVQRKGVNNLNETLVKYIRDRAEVLSQAELSELLNISKAQINRVVNKSTWRWL